MCGTCGTRCEKQKGLGDFGGELWSKEAALEALGTWEGNIKVNYKKKIGWEGTEWSNLCRYKDKSHFIFNTAMNIRIA